MAKKAATKSCLPRFSLVTEGHVLTTHCHLRTLGEGGGGNYDIIEPLAFLDGHLSRYRLCAMTPYVKRGTPFCGDGRCGVFLGLAIYEQCGRFPNFSSTSPPAKTDQHTPRLPDFSEKRVNKEEGDS